MLTERPFVLLIANTLCSTEVNPFGSKITLTEESEDDPELITPSTYPVVISFPVSGSTITNPGTLV